MSYRQNIKIQWFIAGLAVVLFAVKMFAWLLTDSALILGDALESVVNIAAGLIGLYSLYLSAKPRDEDHPYGHGKIEFISAAIEGALIIFAGIMIIIESVGKFFDGSEIQSLMTGIYLIAFTAVVNYGIGIWAIRTAKRTKSPALQASGEHLLTDVYTTGGIILGLGAVKLTSIQSLDPVIAIAFAVFIVFNGTRIIRRAIAGIMDKADDQLLDNVVSTLEQGRSEHWIDVHNLRVIKYGSVLHFDCHLTLPRYMNVVDAHQQVDLLEDVIRDEYGESTEMFVHIDACKPDMCEFCAVANCAIRKAAFKKQIVWTPYNIRLNSQHQLEDEH
ncbi:MAG: cation transporter [Gammaproteobacteria bacterium]|nr:cation transporter [Gammaproteobacteria bacterium]